MLLSYHAVCLLASALYQNWNSEPKRSYVSVSNNKMFSNPNDAKPIPAMSRFAAFLQSSDARFYLFSYIPPHHSSCGALLWPTHLARIVTLRDGLTPPYCYLASSQGKTTALVIIRAGLGDLLDETGKNYRPLVSTGNRIPASLTGIVISPSQQVQ
jgi:hypothetical protein